MGQKWQKTAVTHKHLVHDKKLNSALMAHILGNYETI